MQQPSNETCENVSDRSRENILRYVLTQAQAMGLGEYIAICSRGTGAVRAGDGRGVRLFVISSAWHYCCPRISRITRIGATEDSDQDLQRGDLLYK